VVQQCAGNLFDINSLSPQYFRTKFQDLTGQVFGRLTVLSHSRRILPSGKSVIHWNCVCACGQTLQVSATHIKGGHTKSCGCLNREVARQRHVTHGHAPRGTPSRTYRSYNSMFQRCYNPKCERYPSYGGRGITVCARWSESFENFLADMGERPAGMAIDRKDNDLGYSKNNCRWATQKQEMRNTSRNRNLMIDNETLCVSAWAERSGISAQTLLDRVDRGWESRRAVFEPVSQKS
jgi:hypothetical protein